VKRIKILTILIVISVPLYRVLGQSNLKTEKVEDGRLIKVLNELTFFTEKKTRQLSIRVFTVGNESGSAGFGSCEITHQIYIATSECGELPEQNLFVIGPFYNPTLSGWSEKEGQELTIEYGESKSRKRATIKISFDKIEIKK
jgi:hypothetical protein